MGWGKEWPKTAEDILKHDSGITPELLGIKIDLPVISQARAKDIAAIKQAEMKEYLNKVPTHDPYTNPDATIYYECGCGAILDPNTKSFAALNNHASEKGWKIRFSEKGYTPYCVKCGEGVE